MNKKIETEFQGLDLFDYWKKSEIIKGEIEVDDSIRFDFEECNFKNANFGNMKLGGFNFSHSDLRNSSFRSTELEDSEFSTSDLVGANFKGAMLQGSKFINSDLRGVDFTDAKFYKVHFDKCIVGINPKDSIRLERKAYMISTLAGVISAYAAGYLIFLISSSFFKSLDKFPPDFSFTMSGILALPYLLIFFTSAKRAIEKGIGSYFPGFLLITVLASFLYQAVDPDESGTRVASVILGLSCFIGAFAGLLAMSQAVYLVNELTFLAEGSRRKIFKLMGLSLKIEPKLILLGFCSFIGIILGAVSGGGYQNPTYWIFNSISSVFGGIICYLGYMLGAGAADEKQLLRKNAGNMSIEDRVEKEIRAEDVGEDGSRSINTTDIVGLINRIREQKKSQIYSSIRLYVDNELDTLKTNLSGVELVDTSFDGSVLLHKTNFSPALIESPNDWDIDTYRLLGLGPSYLTIIGRDNNAPVTQGGRSNYVRSEIRTQEKP